MLALCRAGADMAAVARDGTAPIHLAAAKGHKGVLLALVDDLGCGVNMVSGKVILYSTLWVSSMLCCRSIQRMVRLH